MFSKFLKITSLRFVVYVKRNCIYSERSRIDQSINSSVLHTEVIFIQLSNRWYRKSVREYKLLSNNISGGTTYIILGAYLCVDRHSPNSGVEFTKNRTSKNQMIWFIPRAPCAPIYMTDHNRPVDKFVPVMPNSTLIVTS